MSKIRYRRRRSRAKSERVEAIQFMGFEALPIGSNNKPAVPDWLPPIDLQVFDTEGTYDSDEIEPTPPGKIWQMGQKFARFGLHDGHRDCLIGDYIVRAQDGSVFPMPRKDFEQEYRAL